MDSKWFAGLSQEERDEMRKLLGNHSLVLDKLKKIVYNNRESKDKVQEADYDNPSWPYWQADRNGYKRACDDFIRLLDLNPRKQNK